MSRPTWLLLAGSLAACAIKPTNGAKDLNDGTAGGAGTSAGVSGSAGSAGSSAGASGAGASGVSGAGAVAGAGAASGTGAGAAAGASGAGAGGISGASGAGTAGVSGSSAGASGSAGAGGSGGTPVVAGPPYTFPQNYQSQWCTRPAGADPNVAKAAYKKFHDELVVSAGAGGNLRVTRPGSESDTTVSEGIGYGMILAVVMDDQTTFDALWKYEQAHLDKNGLMNWKIDPSGNVSMDGQGAATDADEDMAWALLQADRKWGGGGSLTGKTYKDEALAQIDKIWNFEVDHSRGGLLLAGDSWGMVITHNPSYFAPNQYRRFGAATGKTSDWNGVIDRNYTELMNTLQASAGNQNNGLAPPWADESGKVMQPFMGAPTYYQYDSARIPFRIAQDYCDFGEARAKTYLDKVSAFFASQGASSIVDGYNLDGTTHAAHALPVQSALFVGAAGVAAMSDPSKAAFVSQTWQILANPSPSATVLLPESYYFNLCWLTFSTLMQTGNLYDYQLR